MPVSGVVIQIDPHQNQQIVAALRGEASVELQPVPGLGVLVAVLDTDSFGNENALVQRISGLPGVKNVVLSYHNFEDMVEPAALPAEGRLQ